MKNPRLAIWAWLLGATIFLQASPAPAAPSDTDKERARILMDEGDALVEKKNHAEALEKYRKAHSIMRVTTTGIEVARTLAALGRLVEAKRAAHEAAGIPPAPGEPQAFTTARRDAQLLARELDARVPQLTVATSGVAPGKTLKLRIDGKPVPSPEVEQPQDVDPGEHSVSGEAGSAVASVRVVLKEGERQTVTLAFASEKTGTSPHGPTGPDSAVPSEEKPPMLGYVIGGIGLAGLAIGGVTAVIYYNRHQSIKDECPEKDRCSQDGLDKIDKQKTLGTVNAVALAVGVIGTGVGAYLILSHGKSKETTAVVPRWAPGRASISLERSF